jgi:hypothetical protein
MKREQAKAGARRFEPQQRPNLQAGSNTVRIP